MNQTEIEITPIDGEIADEETIVKAEPAKISEIEPDERKIVSSAAWVRYIAVPVIFLAVSLLGGLRLGLTDGELLFHPPALICLIFSAMMMVLFVRAGSIRINGWFSERFSPLKNIANGAVFLSLFAACMQVFNALIPEQGLLFWLVGFFFLWSLWTNLFAIFETKKLFVSLGSLFGMAFIAKYLVFANFASAESGFFNALVSGNLTREAVTYLLDLPRYSAGTGYIQFFTVIFFMIGLFIFPPVSDDKL